jgi:acetylornithine deacetylase/succinyl-diaminopimelate desuccinylase-like protein
VNQIWIGRQSHSHQFGGTSLECVIMGLMRDAGLEVSIDTAGNLVGERAGSDAALKPIVIGSHIDSVPEGGNYDGDVGSLGAIEVLVPAAISDWLNAKFG